VEAASDDVSGRRDNDAANQGVGCCGPATPLGEQIRLAKMRVGDTA
jgi:hypothetical protein